MLEGLLFLTLRALLYDGGIVIPTLVVIVRMFLVCLKEQLFGTSFDNLTVLCLRVLNLSSDKGYDPISLAIAITRR
ncbi:hypothetical protein Tco_1474250 [Tanacetum coccineum]